MSKFNYTHYVEISEGEKVLARVTTTQSLAEKEMLVQKAKYPDYKVMHFMSSEKEKVFNHIPQNA